MVVVAVAMTAVVHQAVEMSAQSCAFSVVTMGPHQHPFPSIAIIAQPPFSAKNICTMVSYYES